MMQRLKEGVHSFLCDSAIKALNEQDIFTVRDFICCDSGKLSKISLLLFKEVLEIKRTFLKNFASVSQNGYDCYQDLLKNSALISSGIHSVDDFFGGGLFTSNIYEIYGRAASGKSLLAYMFIKNVVLEMKQNCFLLDTKNDFCVKRFYSICGEYPNEDITTGLSRIFIKSIENKYDLLNSLQEILEKLENNSTILRFVVIDSLTAVISNPNDYLNNNIFFTHLANIMHYIATKYHIVFLVTNLMTTWVEGDFSAQGNTQEKVSCGKFWYSIPNSRIKLVREEQILQLSVEKSNTLAPNIVSIHFDDIVSEKRLK